MTILFIFSPPASYPVFLPPLVPVFPSVFPVFPGIFVGPLSTVVVTAFGVSILGRPRSVVFPNDCFFARCSSSYLVAGEVSVGSSMDVLPSDDPCSHPSNLTGPFDKRMGPFGSRPNQRHSAASDTSALPTGATTIHCRNKSPHVSLGRHRHTSPGSLQLLEVRQIR